MNNFFKRLLLTMVSFSLIGLFMPVSVALADPLQEDAILMSVNGEEYVSNTMTPIIMSFDPEAKTEPVVIVPGDVLNGELNIKNNGPEKGVLKAYLINIENNGPDELSMDDWFSGDVKISANDKEGSLVYWDSESQGGDARSIEGTEHVGTQILEEELEQGEVSNLQLTVEFPAEYTSGNSAGSNASPNGIPNDYSPGSRSSSFYVYLVLSGIPNDSTNPTEPTSPPDTNNPDDSTGSDADDKDGESSKPGIEGGSDTVNTPESNDLDNDNSITQKDDSSPRAIITGADLASSPMGITIIVVLLILTAVFVWMGKKKAKISEDEVEQ